MPSPPYRRTRGFKPSYTPDETRHYKSQNVRYLKALNLKPAFVEDNFFRFLSPRSASSYWEVSLVQSGSSGGSSGGGSGGSDPCAWTPETPTSGTGCTIEIRTWTGWWAYPGELGEGYYADTDANYNPIYHAGLEPAASQIITTANDNYLLSGGSDQNRTWNLTVSYRLASPVQYDEWGKQLYYLVYNWRCAYVYDNSPFIGYGVYPAPPPIWPDGPDAAIYGIAVHACGGNTASTDPSCPYPPPTNSGGGSSGGGGSTEPVWSCTCPDFTKKQAALTVSLYASEQVDRDWSASNAGTSSDCKHIIAAKLHRRDNFQPSDREPLREPSVPDWLRQDREELRRIRRQWRKEDRALSRKHYRERMRQRQMEREADLSY